MSNEKFNVRLTYYTEKYWQRISGFYVNFNTSGEVIFIRPDLNRGKQESATIRDKKGKIKRNKHDNRRKRKK